MYLYVFEDAEQDDTNNPNEYVGVYVCTCVISKRFNQEKGYGTGFLGIVSTKPIRTFF